MKAIIEHEFEGCMDDCPYMVYFGVLSPCYCGHPSFKESKKIMGYSTKSCVIPEGQKYPDWCPVAKVKI